MPEDTWSNDEPGASEAAAILGRSEWIGGDVGDQEPGFDESTLCIRCEHGHGMHVCARCAGAERVVA